MKIGFFGSEFLHIRKCLNNGLNPSKINEEPAISDFSNQCFELVKQLGRENEVNILTGSDTSITSTPGLSSIVEWIIDNEKMVFDSMDILVIGTIDEDVIRLCQKNKLPFFFLIENESSYQLLDDEDYCLIRGTEIIYPDNALDILSEWMKFTPEERKLRYDYNDIVGRWENLIDSACENCEFLQDGGQYANAEALMRLIYDSYHYYRVMIAGKDSVPCNRLLPYKYAAQVIDLVGVLGSGENEAFESALSGLCHLVEKGFDSSCKDHALPLLPTLHSDGGGTADMSSYKGFEDSFKNHLKRTIKAFDQW